MSSTINLGGGPSAANNSSGRGLVPVSKPTLESLPSDMLNRIVDQLPEDAIMLLKLSSRALNNRIQKPILTKTTWSRFHSTYEWSHRMQGLKQRACHHCFRMLPILEFTDEQHNVENVQKACCFRCMINQGKHEFGGNFSIQGLLMWVCHGCHEPNPHASSAPERMELSEKAWCKKCWEDGRHLLEPRTRYADREW